MTELVLTSLKTFNDINDILFPLKKLLNINFDTFEKGYLSIGTDDVKKKKLLEFQQNIKSIFFTIFKENHIFDLNQFVDFLLRGYDPILNENFLINVVTFNNRFNELFYEKIIQSLDDLDGDKLLTKPINITGFLLKSDINFLEVLRNIFYKIDFKDILIQSMNIWSRYFIQDIFISIQEGTIQLVEHFKKTVLNYHTYSDAAFSLLVIKLITGNNEITRKNEIESFIGIKNPIYTTEQSLRNIISHISSKGFVNNLIQPCLQIIAHRLRNEISELESYLKDDKKINKTHIIHLFVFNIVNLMYMEKGDSNLEGIINNINKSIIDINYLSQAIPDNIKILAKLPFILDSTNIKSLYENITRVIDSNEDVYNFVLKIDYAIEESKKAMKCDFTLNPNEFSSMSFGDLTKKLIEYTMDCLEPICDKSNAATSIAYIKSLEASYKCAFCDPEDIADLEYSCSKALREGSKLYTDLDTYINEINEGPVGADDAPNKRKKLKLRIIRGLQLKMMNDFCGRTFKAAVTNKKIIGAYSDIISIPPILKLNEYKPFLMIINNAYENTEILINGEKVCNDSTKLENPKSRKPSSLLPTSVLTPFTVLLETFKSFIANDTSVLLYWSNVFKSEIDSFINNLLQSDFVLKLKYILIDSIEILFNSLENVANSQISIAEAEKPLSTNDITETILYTIYNNHNDLVDYVARMHLNIGSDSELCLLDIIDKNQRLTTGNCLWSEDLAQKAKFRAKKIKIIKYLSFKEAFSCNMNENIYFYRRGSYYLVNVDKFLKKIDEIYSPKDENDPIENNYNDIEILPNEYFKEGNFTQIITKQTFNCNDLGLVKRRIKDSDPFSLKFLELRNELNNMNRSLTYPEFRILAMPIINIVIQNDKISSNIFDILGTVSENKVNVSTIKELSFILIDLLSQDWLGYERYTTHEKSFIKFARKRLLGSGENIGDFIDRLSEDPEARLDFIRRINKLTGKVSTNVVQAYNNAEIHINQAWDNVSNKSGEVYETVSEKVTELYKKIETVSEKVTEKVTELYKKVTGARFIVYNNFKGIIDKPVNFIEYVSPGDKSFLVANELFEKATRDKDVILSINNFDKIIIFDDDDFLKELNSIASHVNINADDVKNLTDYRNELIVNFKYKYSFEGKAKQLAKNIEIVHDKVVLTISNSSVKLYKDVKHKTTVLYGQSVNISDILINKTIAFANKAYTKSGLVINKVISGTKSFTNILIDFLLSADQLNIFKHIRQAIKSINYYRNKTHAGNIIDLALYLKKELKITSKIEPKELTTKILYNYHKNCDLGDSADKKICLDKSIIKTLDNHNKTDLKKVQFINRANVIMLKFWNIYSNTCANKDMESDPDNNYYQIMKCFKETSIGFIKDILRITLSELKKKKVFLDY